MILIEETLTSDINVQITRPNLVLTQDNLLTKTVTIQSIAESFFASIINSRLLVNQEPSSIINIISA